MQVFNRRNNFCEVKFKFSPLLNKSLCLYHLHEVTARQVLKKQVEVFFILECVADVYTIIGLVQLIQDVTFV